MATQSYHLYYQITFISTFLLFIPHTTQLQSSQSWSLLRIQHLLNYPSLLSQWHESTDFCYGAPQNAPASVVCYQDSVTQLHIIGNEGTPPLPKTFSMDSFITTLTRLPDLKVLTLTSLGLWGPLSAKISRLSNLEIINISSNYFFGAIPHEISRLSNLQTMILDYNMFSGQVPDWLTNLPLLAVLSLRNNTLDGNLPDSIGSITSLRSLTLSLNNLSGDVPDLTGLKNLQILDLENNSLGPNFPKLGRRIITVVLKGNKFSGGLPPDVGTFYLLEHLDISSNRFVGPFAPSLLSLPAIKYLSIEGNRFTGTLVRNMSCNEELEFVDLSENLLSGNVPACLDPDNQHSKAVLYSGNCLGGTQNSAGKQNPFVFCQNQALAVGIVTPRKEGNTEKKKKTGVAVGIVGAVALGVLLGAILVFFALRRKNARKASKRAPRRLVEHASSAYPSKMLTDARYISQTAKLGALGIPSYRSFSLVDLEAATSNFEKSNLLGEDSYGQMYRGRLSSGTLVTIRCIQVKKGQPTLNFNHHIETISKLRHRHLVSALGHCIEYNLEDSTVTQLFLVFEYVPNGDLRSKISHGEDGQKLSWTQRISAAIGVAKGIQFLHGGIIPGLFANNLKIMNVLLDQNLGSKIRSYNLPMLSENTKAEMHGDKIDIYDFGVILLEIVSGRPITSYYEVQIMRSQLQSAIASDGAACRRAIADPEACNICSDESLRTVMEICLRCLSKDPTQRPSIEDVLWNLQFAAQVQEGWHADSGSSEDSPLSPSQPCRATN
ncbi:putative inactive leucine-rich repeat receptor-like protein kinase [Carex littledalei]|uniref:Putative inactive leucine-rich repeat receptor-like protein kinase n=1 Tax=Carex littledalei TaxID=544730 RepID=A0A833VQF3_9POAL|nr:putative inactive leucine-rich repeat receptor-like protein kinase [Carex littledalei]